MPDYKTARFVPIIDGSGNMESGDDMDRLLVLNGTLMEEIAGFARAVRVGPFVCVGGTAPLDANGKTVGVGDVAAQTRRCLGIIKNALERAGAGLEDVVRTRTLLIRINDRQAVAEIRAEVFRAIKPVDTFVQVSQFVNPEWLVEIEVDAVMKDPAAWNG